VDSLGVAQGRTHPVEQRPKIRGLAASKSAQNVASSTRRSSGMEGSEIRSERSCKSPRVAMSSIPFSLMGRLALKMISSSSV
jgi:hypothetical protein